MDPTSEKRPPFGAEAARPVSSADLSVGALERNGTKPHPERQFLHLAMAARAKLEPRASDPTGASADLSVARLEHPGPPNGQKQLGINNRPSHPPRPQLASAIRTASLPGAKQGPGLVVVPIEQEREPQKGAEKMLIRTAWRV